MNTIKTISKLVALSLMTVAVSGFAITDDDSVHSWGPWSTLVQPAAGPQAPTPTTLAGPVVPGFGTGDTNQFTPVVETPGTGVTPVEGRCVAGSVCGYALISQAISIDGDDPVNSSLQSATPILAPIPVDNNQIVLMLDGVPNFLNNVAAVNTSLTVNSDTNLVISESLNVPVNFFRGTSWNYFMFGNNRVVGLNGTTIDVAGTPFAYGSSFNVDLSDSGSINTNFIYGEATGLGDLNALNTGNVTAAYNGVSLRSGTSVNINVDFGAGTWNGSWNRGRDGGSRVSMSSDGVNVLSGNIGFEASGTLNGSNIVSTSVSAADASAIAGTVNGSFFGGDAGVLAGAVDITKSVAGDGGYTDGVYQDLYVTGTGDVVVNGEGNDR